MGQGVRIEGWYDRKATAEYLEVTECWLEKHCHNLDVAPPYIRHGRKVWYRFEDLQIWLANEAKVANARAPTPGVLSNVHHLKHRRTGTVPPKPSDMLEQYLAEHGPTDIVIRRSVWEQLRATFTHAQRAIAKNGLAAAPS